MSSSRRIDNKHRHKAMRVIQHDTGNHVEVLAALVEVCGKLTTAQVRSVLSFAENTKMVGGLR